MSRPFQGHRRDAKLKQHALAIAKIQEQTNERIREDETAGRILGSNHRRGGRREWTVRSISSFCPPGMQIRSPGGVSFDPRAKPFPCADCDSEFHCIDGGQCLRHTASVSPAVAARLAFPPVPCRAGRAMREPPMRAGSPVGCVVPWRCSRCTAS